MVYKSLKSLLTSIPFGESFFLISWYANFHIFRDIIYYETIKISNLFELVELKEVLINRFFSGLYIIKYKII